MATRTDPFIKVTLEADRLLKELGIDTYPICPFDIARKLNVELRPLPRQEGGASGMLLHVGGEVGICYPTHVDNEGFTKFSVAHEIGHLRLPGHIDAVCDATGAHQSRAEYRSNDQYEVEADHFAAALLMPETLFTKASRTAGDGLTAIEKLANDFETSIEATANRFVSLSREPLVVVRSTGKVIDHAIMSGPFKDISGLKWIRRGTPLPESSATLEFNNTSSNVLDGERSDGSSPLQDWFGGTLLQEVKEEVIGLGSYGKTLTILSEIESPDELEDEDSLGEWNPKFHR